MYSGSVDVLRPLMKEKNLNLAVTLRYVTNQDLNRSPTLHEPCRFAYHSMIRVCRISQRPDEPTNVTGSFLGPVIIGQNARK